MLAHELELSQVGVSRMCSRLEEAGWIERRAHPTDRRVWIVELLPPARDALATALRLVDEQQKDALRELSPRDRGELMRLLHAVRASLAR